MDGDEADLRRLVTLKANNIIMYCCMWMKRML